MTLGPTPQARARRAPTRAMTLEMLDDVYRVASLDQPLEQRLELLTIALREHVTEREAKNQAKKMVTRIWLNPPEPAAAMIRWAIDNPAEFPDHRVLHLGALLATTPFVASVMAHLGRSFALDEHPTVPALRRRIVGVWGASTGIEEAVGKTITTLRRLGAVEGGGRKPIVRSRPFAATPLAATWLVHATMLARELESLDTVDATRAPELFWARDLAPSTAYPLLVVHTEGNNRKVWAPR